MANIKSAKKRILVNQKKNLDNRMQRSRMNNAIKKFNNAIDTLNLDEAERLLPSTMSVIDESVSKGVIHKNNAANKKSAIAKRLSDVKSGKLSIHIKKDNKTIAAEKAKAAQLAREQAKLEFQRKAAEKKAAQLEKQKADAEKNKASAKKPAKAKEEKVKEEKPVKEKKAKEEKAKETAETAEPKKTAKKKKEEE